MCNYILVGKEPKKVDDYIEWVKAMQTQDKIVGSTLIGEVKVSTVFMGIDHSFSGGKPLLFETMIFGGAEDGFIRRYSTWDEAVEGHKRAVDLAHNLPI